MKLLYRQIPELRQQQLGLQGNQCGLCCDTIVDDAVLDHDHSTGQIRGVLHRGCNALLGKIENNMARNRVDMARLSGISKNLIRYLTADPVTEFLHPTHKQKEPKMGRGRGRGRKPPKR